jgi:hypothetical protein
MPDSWSVIIVTGLLVGFGTRLGGGFRARRVRCSAAIDTLDRSHGDLGCCSVASPIRTLTNADSCNDGLWFHLRLGITDLRYDATREGHRLMDPSLAVVMTAALVPLYPR